MVKSTRQPAPSPAATPARPANGNQLLAANWSGPLPPPAALEHFNEIIPNGAERIMAMVEAEQAHRLEYDSSRLKLAARDHNIGQWLGAILCAAAIGAVVYTATIGAHPTVSIALVGLPIAAVIRSIVRRRDDNGK